MTKPPYDVRIGEMAGTIKKTYGLITSSIVTTAIFLLLISHIPLTDTINNRIYDQLVKIKYTFSKAPRAINDIVLVLIDNNTLNHMAVRWPYPRSDFSKVIDNLEKAGAKTIAFDFAFLGGSSPEDDAHLKASLEKNNNVILACSVNENGLLDFRSLPACGLTKEIPSGIVTKIQDNDGVTRKAITYLVSDKDPKTGFLSWEMQILKNVESVHMDSISYEKERVIFTNNSGKSWAIPVNAGTKSFLINFAAHTTDFKRLSFFNVLKDDFDYSIVKNKIALVGLASSVLADIHNTPLGWLPGITLNANAFLTIYGQYYLKTIPDAFGYIVVILGTILASLFFTLQNKRKRLMLVVSELIIFILFSYLLILKGYVWNYSDFILAVIICPAVSKKLLDLTCRGLCV